MIRKFTFTLTIAFLAWVTSYGQATITYTPATNVFTVGTDIGTLSPKVTGTVTSYAITPTLPASLSFNTATGAITGKPTVTSAAADYTVTATSAGGSGTFKLNITINNPAAPSISYGTQNVFTVGVQISPLSPTTSAGGQPASYSINPTQLPAGLTFDGATGTISGKPTAVSAAANYTVTATNAGGSGTFSIPITVNNPPPPTISYKAQNVFIVGTAITTPLSPTVVGGTVTSYAINPALPAGLTFDASKGSISGTPTAASPAANYVVTATSAAGTSNFTISITVNLPPPPIISYASPDRFIVNTAIPPDVNPKFSGGPVTSYSVSPNLPAGLTLNTSSGNISGTPTAVSAETNYTITANGPGGTSTASLAISVQDPAVPYVTYPSPNSFPAGTAITILSPTITGGTATAYTISPNLPGGLSIDGSKGTISGVPAVASSKRTYVVTATTSAGTRYANVDIEITPNISSNVYSPRVSYLKVDVPMASMRPNGDTLYSVYTVTPALPNGLRLNDKTGEITGTPSKAYTQRYYRIKSVSISADSVIYVISLTVSPLPDKLNQPTASIEFVGEGSIQQSISNGSKLPASTGIGVIYRENSKRRYGLLHNIEVDFSINVASTIDTIKAIKDNNYNVTNKADFGNSVLLPLNSGQAFSFGFLGYFSERGGKNGNYQRNAPPSPLGGILSGFKVSVAGSNRNWQYDSVRTVPNNSTNPPSTTTQPWPLLVKASTLSIYSGVFYEFLKPTLDENKNYVQNSSVTLGMGYSGRFIFGDVQQPTQAFLRNKLLGSDLNSFNGFEIQLCMRFYNIKAEAHLPFLSRKGNIPGLSGAQPTTFIGFSGGFPIDLTKKPSSTP